MKERSKVTCFQYVFDELREIASQQKVPYQIHQRHYVDTTPQEDIETENIKSLEVFTTENTTCILFELNKIRYVGISGIEIDHSLINQYFTEVETSAGFWTALIHIGKIKPNNDASGLEIFNKVLAVESDTPSAKAIPVSYDTVREFYPKLSVYQVDSGSVFFDHNAARTLGYINCARTDYQVKRSSTCREEYMSTYLSSCNHIPFELVLHAYNSKNKKHSFIELYRCVENLFPIPTTREMRISLGINAKCPIEFARLAEDLINWRPTELTAITKIINEADYQTKAALENARDSIPANARQNLDSFFYKLRNSSVHYRRALGTGTLTDEQWDKVIEGTLLLIQDMYKKYDADLSLALAPPKPPANKTADFNFLPYSRKSNRR